MADEYNPEPILAAQAEGREKIRQVISEDTRKSRVKVLLTSAFAIALAVTEKFPTKIPLVDIPLDASHGRIFLICLLCFHLVLLFTFITGAHPDREIGLNTAQDLKERLAYDIHMLLQNINNNIGAGDRKNKLEDDTKIVRARELERLELAEKVAGFRRFLELWLPGIIGLVGAGLLLKLVVV